MELQIRKSPMGMKELKWLSERAVCTGFKPNRKRCQAECEAPWDWTYRFDYPHLVVLSIQHIEADGSWRATCRFNSPVAPVGIIKSVGAPKEDETFERSAEEYKEFFDECKKFVKKLRR